MKLTTTRTINAPVDAVWNLVAERFADIGDWSEAVVKSTLDGAAAEGAVRTCELKPTPAASGRIRERITRFDRAGRVLAYDVIDGMPGFMRLVNNRWTFERQGDGRTRATSLLTIEVVWFMAFMLPVIRRQFSKTLEPFFAQIETAAKRPVGKVEPIVAAG